MAFDRASDELVNDWNKGAAESVAAAVRRLKTPPAAGLAGLSETTKRALSRSEMSRSEQEDFAAKVAAAWTEPSEESIKACADKARANYCKEHPLKEARGKITYRPATGWLEEKTHLWGRKYWLAGSLFLVLVGILFSVHAASSLSGKADK